MATRSARATAFGSISGILIELKWTPGSIQRSKKMWSRLLLAHSTISAPLIASSGCSTATTSTPSAALISRENATRFSGLGEKQRMAVMSAHRADRHELRAGLPAGAEKRDGLGIFSRQIFDAEAVGGATRHALHQRRRERSPAVHRFRSKNNSTSPT